MRLIPEYTGKKFVHTCPHCELNTHIGDMLPNLFATEHGFTKINYYCTTCSSLIMQIKQRWTNLIMERKYG